MVPSRSLGWISPHKMMAIRVLGEGTDVGFRAKLLVVFGWKDPD